MWSAFALPFTYKGIGKFHTLTKSKVHGVPTCVPEKIFDLGTVNWQQFTWAKSQTMFIPRNMSSSNWNNLRDLPEV